MIPSVINMACWHSLVFLLWLVDFNSAFYDPYRRGPYGIEPGPQVVATQGEIWPLPQSILQGSELMSVDPRNFKIVITGKTCDILQQAVARYQNILRNIDKQLRRAHRKVSTRMGISKKLKKTEYVPLENLQVSLMEDCESLPYLGMNEAYNLAVNSANKPRVAVLISKSVWGILRGLESFVQLVYAEQDTAKLLIKTTQIYDFPRFSYRGLLQDTGRHFIPVRQIFLILDGMTMNKLNVFHWHVVDDQSFPYESSKYPELSQKGAYSPLHVYTALDVANVIEYARVRGIRVIPEFDTPGHTRSWGIAHPELLTPCYDSQEEPDGSLGPMHPLKKSTYTFMDNLLSEIRGVFKDQFIHLGADEVPFECWQSNPDIYDYMVENNLSAQNLEEIYIQKVIDLSGRHNFTPIVWQEVYDNGDAIPNNTVVHVWKDWTDYMSEMANITHSGYNAILSSCWYLDHLSSGGDWTRFYECDPTFFPGSTEAHQRVLGGEACMWAEVVDTNNVLSRIFPRASAAAEKLWSAAVSTTNYGDATNRMEEHYCRMNMRGIPAQPPNGPGFCPYLLYN